ncbi:MAG: mutarotase [Lewinellaceae bacterium]|nr:mutarotase [Lewinellaceae bacterium]
MWEDALAKFKQGSFEYDPWLNAKTDNRYGITLLARPPEAIKNRIISLMETFMQAEPDQYYYPVSDLHITILSIISCREGFSLSDIDPQAYILRLEEALNGKRAISIHFRGLSASPGCILLQGFPENEELEHIRNVLRKTFKTNALTNSIDSRYRLETAHATVVRFKKPVANPRALIEIIQQFRAIPIGTFSVNHLELVFNDWYQRREKTVVLGRFPLEAVR